MLHCPHCGGDLAERGEALVCACGLEAPVRGGVLRFPLGERPVPPFYQDCGYKEAAEKFYGITELHNDPKRLSGRLEGWLRSQLRALVPVDAPRPWVEIGCGAGTAFHILGYPEAVLGIDIRAELLERMRQRYPGAEAVQADLLNSPFRPGSVRTAFSIYSLEHIFELEAFVAALHRMLHPEGRLHALIPAEGGLAWGALRLMAHWAYSRRLGLDYKAFMAKEHCNSAPAIENALKKQFHFEARRTVPWRFGGAAVDRALAYRLRPR